MHMQNYLESFFYDNTFSAGACLFKSSMDTSGLISVLSTSGTNFS